MCVYMYTNTYTDIHKCMCIHQTDIHMCVCIRTDLALLTTMLMVQEEVLLGVPKSEHTAPHCNTLQLRSTYKPAGRSASGIAVTPDTGLCGVECPPPLWSSASSVAASSLVRWCVCECMCVCVCVCVRRYVCVCVQTATHCDTLRPSVTHCTTL